MSRIGNIYTESYSKSSAAISADGGLSEMIREEIVDRICLLYTSDAADE